MTTNQPVDWDQVQAALCGELPYDALEDAEQAAVRDGWDEAISEGLANLDLRARFEAEGHTSWTEATPAGDVVVHDSRAER